MTGERSGQPSRVRGGEPRRWLVTGSGGMLGSDLVTALAGDGADVTGLSRKELDVTDEVAVAVALADCRPDVVVNCAAWTAVDDAEAHEDEALAVNGTGAAHVAAAIAGAVTNHAASNATIQQMSGQLAASVPAPGTIPGMSAA